MAEVIRGVENVSFKSPPLSKGLMKEAPVETWVDKGGVWDVENMVCKDGTMVFGPGYDQLDGGALTDISSFGSVEQIIPLDYSTTRVGLVITTTSLFYITTAGFTDVTSADLNDDDDCRDIFTHTNRYVDYAIGLDGNDSFKPCIWFVNGEDPVYQLIDGVLSAVLTTDFPEDERPWTVAYKDNRLFFGGIGTEYNVIQWGALNNPSDFTGLDVLYLEGINFDTPPSVFLSFNKFFIIGYPDFIFIGQQSNLLNLPYRFEVFSNTKLGITEQRGHVLYNNTFYFMYNYQFYMIDSGLNVQEIQHFLNRDMKNNLNTSIFMGHDPGLQQIYIGATGTGFLYAYNPYMDAWGKLKFASPLNAPTAMASLELASTNYSTPCLISAGKIYKLGYGATGYTYPTVILEMGPMTFNRPEEKKTVNEVGLYIRCPKAISTAVVFAVTTLNEDGTTVSNGNLSYTMVQEAFTIIKKLSIKEEKTQFLWRFTTTPPTATPDVVYIEGLYARVRQRYLDKPSS